MRYLLVGLSACRPAFLLLNQFNDLTALEWCTNYVAVKLKVLN